MLRDALLATWRRTLSGLMPPSKLLRLLMLPFGPSALPGTASESILAVGEVAERRWSMGELDAELLPAVDGRRMPVSTRFMEGEDGRPMNIPDRRFESGSEPPATGDSDADAGGVDAAAAACCSSRRCCASGATS